MNNEAIDKNKKTEEMKEYHQRVFEALGIDPKCFYPKMVFSRNGKDVMAMFPSEMDKSVFYTEIITKDYEPKDPRRILWKMVHKPNYKQIYPVIGPNQDKYAVPLSDLEEVNVLMVTMNKPAPASVPRADDTEKEDENISKMSVRDVAALLLRRPVSNKLWLNQLIIENQNHPK